MINKIEEKKKKIEEQIEKNLLKKKLLIAKEKKGRASKFTNIGRLAYQANIDQFDEDILLGAFIEISKNANEKKFQHWKEISNDFLDSQSTKSDNFICIKFSEEPSQEIKQVLRENKFKWNRFRKEYYGNSKKSDVESLLNGCKFKIEEILN